MERKEQILKWLKEILDKNLSGISFSAFVFGSQANKLVLSKSDIDIGILANHKIPISRIAKIIADIEQLPMLFNIDLIDFNEVDARFKAVALKNIEEL